MWDAWKIIIFIREVKEREREKEDVLDAIKICAKSLLKVIMLFKCYQNNVSQIKYRLIFSSLSLRAWDI